MPDFDALQESFKDAKVIALHTHEGEIPILSITYLKDGQEKQIFTRSHALLAALTYCLEAFYADARTPLESLSGARISHKIPC
jgi:hypothetical protein